MTFLTHPEEAPAKPKTQREPADFYPTPYSAIRPLIDAKILPLDGPWIEPCAGNGAIIRAIPEVREWWASELREEEYVGLALDVGRSIRVWCPLDLIRSQDRARDWIRTIEPRVIITNPPNKDAFTIVRLLREWAPEAWLAIYQPASFLGTLGRWEWFSRNEPDDYRLAERPKHLDHSGGSQEYSWYVWPPSPPHEMAASVDRSNFAFRGWMAQSGAWVRTRGERKILPPHGVGTAEQGSLL